MNKLIKNLIQQYAEVYALFENFQKDNHIPIGDQKTGVIGEYYAYCFYKNQPSVKHLDYALSGKSFDLILTLKNGTEKLIQVKCVSAHSKSRRIAPININDTKKKPFDELMLLDLDESFKPVGMYINSFEELKERIMSNTKQMKRVIGATMKGTFGYNGKSTKGSGIINWDDNRVGELLELI